MLVSLPRRLPFGSLGLFAFLCVPSLLLGKPLDARAVNRLPELKQALAHARQGEDLTEADRIAVGEALTDGNSVLVGGARRPCRSIPTTRAVGPGWWGAGFPHARGAGSTPALDSRLDWQELGTDRSGVPVPSVRGNVRISRGRTGRGVGHAQECREQRWQIRAIQHVGRSRIRGQGCTWKGGAAQSRRTEKSRECPRVHEGGQDVAPQGRVRGEGHHEPTLRPEQERRLHRHGQETRGTVCRDCFCCLERGRGTVCLDCLKQRQIATPGCASHIPHASSLAEGREPGASPIPLLTHLTDSLTLWHGGLS